MDKEDVVRSFLAAHWIGLCAFTAVSWVQSLVRELRSYYLHGIAKGEKKDVVCIYVYIYTHTYTYTMDYYSAMKKNEILPFATTWMDLEGIMLSEISQKKTNTVNVTYMWNLKNETSDCNKEETDSEIQRTN